MRKNNILKKETVRARFAPSPTGFLHIGGARTALFNYIFTKQKKGGFILRVEDTDKERSKPEFEKDIIESLKWLGIDWTEGPIRQSERIDIYKKYLNKLFKEKKAYYCFCSEKDLEMEKQEQMSRGLTPKYSGRCSLISEKEAEKNIQEGKKFVIRLRSAIKKIEFKDIIRGNVIFDSALLGDFVIAKDFKSPLYNFASVVDDYEMKITHIIRGEEHISNTPRQILIQEALGFEKPVYAHIPLILAPDKTKLSKRHGSFSLQDFKKEGYLPEALINFLAFLGWNPGDEREIYSIASLVKDFSMEKVQKSGAVFNIKKLDFINGFYIRNKKILELSELCLPYLVEKGYLQLPSEKFGKEYVIGDTGEKINFESIEKIIAVYQERLKKLSEIANLTEFIFKKEINYNKELLKWKGAGDREVGQVLSYLHKILSEVEDKKWSKKNLETLLLQEAEKNTAGLGKPGDRGYMLWPFRVALTGKNASPGPFEIADILGKEKTLKRIRKAKNML